MNLQFEPEILRPLIADVMKEVLARLEADRARIPGNRLAFAEIEAATLLGLKVHQLRDIRLRGQIGFSRGPGRRVMYSPADLTGYLSTRHVAARPNPERVAEQRLKDKFSVNGKAPGKVRKPRD